MKYNKIKYKINSNLVKNKLFQSPEKIWPNMQHCRQHKWMFLWRLVSHDEHWSHSFFVSYKLRLRSFNITSSFLPSSSLKRAWNWHCPTSLQTSLSQSVSFHRVPTVHIKAIFQWVPCYSSRHVYIKISHNACYCNSNKRHWELTNLMVSLWC